MENKLSHIDESGKTIMVDVSKKYVVKRVAKTSGRITFPEKIFEKLMKQNFLSSKGSIFQTAIIAGIQAAKKTADLIPLCHPLALSKVDIDIKTEKKSLKIVCEVICNGRTGVEMEALTAVSVTALTIYDMCKALSQDIIISGIQLEEKNGGKTDFKR
jgi:cyclic pyranopterin phosphate synthase